MKWGRMAKDINYLKGLVNTEIKYIDENHNSAALGYWDVRASATVGIPDIEANTPTPGYVSKFISYPAQGDDYNQREGRSFKLKSLQLKFTAWLALASQTNAGTARVMVIVDHQAQSGEVTDPVPILFQTDSNGQYSTLSRIDRQQNKRYSVLGSKKFVISNGTVPMKNLSIYKKLSDKIKFNGTLATNFMDKAFYFIVLIDPRVPTIGTNDVLPNFNMQFETRFTYVDN